MKMRKFLLVFSILAVMFSLAGCSDETDAPFDYDETEIVIQTMEYFVQYNDVSDEYKDYYISSGDAFEQSAVKGIDQAVNNDKVGKFEDFSIPISYYLYNGTDALVNTDYEIENASDYVMVTVVNHAENRDVEISVKYVENDEYYIALDQATRGLDVNTILEQLEQIAPMNGMTVEEYVQLLLEQYGVSTLDEFIEIERENAKYSLGVNPYTPEEMVVSAVYSKKELMGQAGMNTLLGMGTVFVVLIFISFIISLFKYLPNLFGKKKDKKADEAGKEPENIPAPVPTFVPAGGENLASNDELVAVITAAIYAAEAASGNSYSKDTLVVRSIKRANR